MLHKEHQAETPEPSTYRLYPLYTSTDAGIHPAKVP